MATPYTLVIGNKIGSSWSLRPWILMKQASISFDEVHVALRQHTTSPEIRKHSPSGLVPLLKHGDLSIWDSLAIAEYLNEQHPDAQLWPADRGRRAVARSAAAEMHSGFRDLRVNLPMEFTSRGLPPQEGGDWRKDVRRIVELWRGVRSAHAKDGPFLFGRFSIADAMYAPVCSRFTSYAVSLEGLGDDGTAEDYRAMMMDLPPMKAWAANCKPWSS